MKRTTMRIAALGMSVLLAGTAAPAMAEDGAPIPVLGISEASGVLTLPAGDGVRDTATFTVTSDVAATVVLDVIGLDDTTVVKTLDPIDLTTEALSAPLTVDVAGLPSGILTLRATPWSGDAAGEPVSSPLRVGSGNPTMVTLALSPKTIDTWSGSSVRSTVATVAAVDETDLAIPFTGTVTAVVGTVKHVASVTSPLGAAAKATISASKLKAGSGTVSATVTGNGKTATSDSVSLLVRKTAVASVKIARSESVVYPTKDGYKDSSKISVSWKSTTGSAIPVTGVVKIINSKGKTVKSWGLSTTKPWSGTWNGKVGTTAVYGTYTVKAAIKGPEGSTLAASTTITVKKGKLVERSVKTTVKADTVLTEYVDLGDLDYNVCYEDYFAAGDIFCNGNDSIDGLSLFAMSTRSVPTAVVDAQKYGGAKVRITAKVSHVYGDVAWGYARQGAETSKSTLVAATGNSTPGWLSLPATTKKLEVFLGLGEYSFVGIGTFTIDYRYKVLSTT